MCKIKIALSNLSEKIFSRKWPSLWEKPIDTLENRVVKLPCRRSMIPGSRMWLWTFWWIERINAKLNLSPRFHVGVRFDTVRESACMACKRSAVRSRYSPPKKHHTSCEVWCFSFCFLRGCIENQPNAWFCRRMDGNPQFLLFRCFWKCLFDAWLFCRWTHHSPSM